MSSIDYTNVSLYVYGLMSILTSLLFSLIYTQVYQDSYAIPLVIVLFISFISASLHSLSNTNRVIHKIQLLSVLGSCIICLFLIYVRIWDNTHEFCCYTSYILNFINISTSVSTLLNQEMFMGNADIRRLLLPVVLMVILCLPVDTNHESIIFFQIILFTFTYYTSLAYMVYVQSDSFLENDSSDPIWYMILMHTCILTTNRLFSCVYSVLLTTVTIRKLGDQYIRHTSQQNPNTSPHDPIPIDIKVEKKVVDLHKQKLQKTKSLGKVSNGSFDRAFFEDFN